MPVTIRCKCGKNEHVFKGLLLEDFPEGLVDDCCLTSGQLTKGVNPVEVPTQIPPKKPRKRRGRKPNGKR